MQSITARLTVGAAAGAVALAGTVLGASSQYTTPNVVTGTGPVVTTLGGYTFTNKGLQGVGRISGDLLDTWTIPGTTTTVHESLGSVSGLQITNWQKAGENYTGTFNTLPDRGYNSGSLFSDYAARIQTINFSFTPYTGSANIGGTTLAQKVAAQSQIVPTYAGTTVFTYAYPGTGAPTVTTGLTPGAGTQALLSQTVPWTASQTIGINQVPVNKLAIDAEGLVLKSDGSGYFSDEYGPNIYHFNPSKQIDAIVTLPEAIRPHKPAGTLNFDSESNPTNGRRGNQGMEAIALSPDGTKLYGLLQSATIQDSVSGSQNRNNTRLLTYDVSTNPLNPTLVAEHALELPRITTSGLGGAVNKTAAQSEIVALGDGKLLVLARDGNGLGTAATDQPVYKSVLLVDTNGATDFHGTARDSEGGKITVTSPSFGLDPTITPVTQAEALNMLNSEQLAKFNVNLGLDANADQVLDGMDQLTISEKWEGLSLVPALDPANPNDYFLFIANDNDFSSNNVQMRQADGTYYTTDAVGSDPLEAINDTVFLAYRVTIVPEPTMIGLLGGVSSITLLRRRRA